MTQQVTEENTNQSDDNEEILIATQYQLMWWGFKKHKPAMISGVVLLIFYILFPIAEFMGIGDPAQVRTQFHYIRPQALHFFESTVDGNKFNPHVKGVRGFRDPLTHKKDYEVLDDEILPVGLFQTSWDYKFLGIIETRKHLIGFKHDEFWSNPKRDEQTPEQLAKSLDRELKKRPSLYLIGSDKVGRDQWSRLLLSNRISLSIGLIGVALSFLFGITLGGISGYYGGIVDTIIQRVIEVIQSVPTLPLWIGLSAAVPRDWGVLQVYLAITIILSVLGWTGTARVVRGKFLSLREEDFVMAAQIAGANEGRIMFRHMLPSFYSHLIAQVSLSIPGMIIGEISLSFLGLGLRAPAVSYGIMLQQAQNPQVVALYPWLMFVAIPVIFIVLAFNFLGDGLRDAADPYGGRT